MKGSDLMEDLSDTTAVYLLRLQLQTGSWVVSRSDEEAVQLYSQIPDIGNKVEGFRRMAVDDHQYHGVIAYELRQGYSLRQHAPLYGPCKDNLRNMECWKFTNDETTKNSLALFVPRLVDGSEGRPSKPQQELLLRVRDRFQLPEHYLTRYGSGAELTALILYHFHRTGEQVPLNWRLNDHWTRTDTRLTNGDHLGLGDFNVHRGGLSAHYFSADYGHKGVGCFPLGVDILTLPQEGNGTLQTQSLTVEPTTPELERRNS